MTAHYKFVTQRISERIPLLVSQTRVITSQLRLGKQKPNQIPLKHQFQHTIHINHGLKTLELSIIYILTVTGLK